MRFAAGHPRRLVRPVGQSFLEPLFHERPVEGRAGRLAQKAFPAFAVVVQLKPRQCVKQQRFSLGRAALAVGVFHAQQKFPAVMPREQVIENRRADVPEVNLARGTGRKAYADIGTHGMQAMSFGFVWTR